MTTLREAMQEFVADLVADNDCGGCGHFKYYAERFRAALEQHDKDVQWLKERQEHWCKQKSLWERAMHSQCAQGCEFLAMEQRRNEREQRLKERGFE
jgi:hypothetical protein